MHAISLIRTLFEYKAWANDDLFKLLRSLPEDSHLQEKHDATRVLNHIYVVDRIFEANVQGKKHSYTAVNTPETPSLASLHEAVQGMDKWFLEYVSSLTESSLGDVIAFTFVDGAPGRMSRGEMLVHVVTHGNYHRGAVGRILSQMSVTPPRDILTKFLHMPGRQRMEQT